MEFSNKQNNKKRASIGSQNGLKAPFITPISTPVIQKKLEIGEPDDKYEVEADRMADRVVQMKPIAVDKPKPTGTVIQRKCTSCEEEEHIQKKALVKQVTPLIQKRGTNLGEKAVASHTVTNNINQSRGRGKSLNGDIKQHMESGFGTDFSNVRIHTDSNAVNLSQQLNAQAFTVGNDIYFNQGKYNPNSNSGKHLLAHELTHTLQQGKGSNLIQRFSCTQILNAEEGQRVNGIRAHNAITADFRNQVGDRARGFRIPGATSLPVRLPCGDTPADYIPPMVFIDQLNTRANVGIPDLAYIDNNRDVHLAEIKIGIHTCKDQAENQLGRYVDQANMDDQEMVNYKNSRYMRRNLERMGLAGGGLENFHLMNPNSVGYNVPNSIMVDNTEVHLGDCHDGVIVYKNLGEQNEDKHFCDKNADDFIDSIMDRAEEMVDNYLDSHIDRLISQAINTLSLEDMIKLAYQHARPAIRDLVISNSNQAVWMGIESMGDEQAVASLAAYIQNELGTHASAALRPIIQQAKSAIINVIRNRMKQALRGFVEGIIRQLCSRSATVSAAMALAAILQNIGSLFQHVLNGVIQEAALAAAAAIAITAIIMMILVIVAIVVIIVVIVLAIPEILAALGVGGSVTAAGTTAVGTTAAGTTALGTTAAGTTALGSTTVGATAVTATGVNVTLVQVGGATTITAANTNATASTISMAAAALLSFFTSDLDDDSSTN